MSNLRVFDPFAAETFDDVLRGFLRPIRNTDLPTSQIRVDIDETDKTYQVKAELPGVKKEDIHVDVDGNLVSIRAEVKNERDVKRDGKVLRSERYYGAVSRAFTLGSDIDDKAVIAKFADGLLELTLPKRANGDAKRITIQ